MKGVGETRSFKCDGGREGNDLHPLLRQSVIEPLVQGDEEFNPAAAMLIGYLEQRDRGNEGMTAAKGCLDFIASFDRDPFFALLKPEPHVRIEQDA